MVLGKPRSAAIYPAVFLTSAGVLMLQVALTRLIPRAERSLVRTLAGVLALGIYIIGVVGLHAARRQLRRSP